MRFLLALLTLPLLALDNGQMFYNQTASALTSRVVTGHWYLAEGDIPNFPRPYVTPSDTGTRAAATYWQADVKSRWRDSFRTRAITGVRTAPPTFATSAGTLVRIVEDSSDISTVTTSVPHGFQVGDRILIHGATGDLDLNKDHYVVLSVLTSTTLTISTQNVSAGPYLNAGLTLRHVIDPNAEGSHQTQNLCRIVSPDHRLEVADSVTISGVDGITGVNGTWRVSATSKDEFLINTTCSGAYAGGGAVAGPSFGSVKTVLVSAIVNVPASGSVYVDLVNSADQCHLGDSATCTTAGLDKAGMLAFDGGTWDAQLSTTANVKSGSTATITTSARAMLTAWDGTESYCRPRYWQRGPVVTQLILEYACAGEQTYDFGWRIVPGGQLNTTTGAISSPTQTEIQVVSAANFEVGTRLWFMGAATVVEHMTVTAISGNTLTVLRGVDGSTPTTWAAGKYFGTLQWQDATDAAKSLHPSFALTFNTGWAGVKIETRVENDWWNKQQGIWYAPTLVVGGVTRFTKPEFKHAARTSWRKVYWTHNNPDVFCEAGSGTDGDDCAGSGGGTRQIVLRVDHNTDYLTYSKAILSWPRNSSNAGAYSWWYSLAGGGFNQSDMGDFAVTRRLVYNQSASTPIFPLRFLGTGTWGSDSYNVTTAQKDFTNGTQEGWPFPRMIANWVQTWDQYGYKLLYGTPLSGGGGNSAVENYIPWAYREDAARGPYVAGWPDSAAGRYLSTHSRPTQATTFDNLHIGAVLPADQPKVACAPTPGAAYSSAINTEASQWPCYHYLYAQGADSWLIETAHMNEWSYSAWLFSGDEWYIRTMLEKAAFSAGRSHSLSGGIGRNLGKIWAWSGQNDHIRNESWGTQSISHALNAVPTELLWGQTSTPERNLLLAQMWDGVMFAEGTQKQTDGWASILYGPLFTTDCTGWSASLNSAISSDRYRFGRCNMGQPNNALGYFPPNVGAVACNAGLMPNLDCTVASTEIAHWMLSYSNVVWNRSLDLGFPGYRYAREKLGKLLINATLNRDFSPYLFGFYYGAGKLVATGTLPQTWAEWYSEYSASAKAVASWVDVGGTTYSETGYSYRLWSALSFYTDLVDNTTEGCQPSRRPPVGCTGTQAFQWFRSNNIVQNVALAQEAKYYLQPRPVIESVRASLSGGTATISWTAPDGGACRVTLNPTSSLDTGSTATAIGRAQSFSTSAVSGDVYQITCGAARLKGTL